MGDFMMIAVACVFGFWGYSVCDGKGRTPWKGFIAGFFGGLIGVGICYYIDKK